MAQFNPIALRKAKIVYNFGLSECNWVNAMPQIISTRMLLHLEKCFIKRLISKIIIKREAGNFSHFTFSFFFFFFL